MAFSRAGEKTSAELPEITKQPNARTEPADLREAKAKLAELETDYTPDSPTVQRQLARIKELERLTREEPNAPPMLGSQKLILVLA